MTRKGFIPGVPPQLLGALLVVGLILVLFGGIPGSLDKNDVRPFFDNCPLDDSFNVQNKCERTRLEMEVGSRGSFGSGAGLWAVVDTDLDGNPIASKWFFYNGYVKPGNEDEPDYDIDWNDVEVSGDDLDAIEAASTCRITADVGSFREVDIFTSETQQRYDDDPDDIGQKWDGWYAGELLHSRHIFPNPVTVEADEMQIKKGRVFCKFNMGTMMDKGMELPGTFEKWEGKGGEELDHGEIYVEFREPITDSDTSGTGTGSTLDSDPDTTQASDPVQDPVEEQTALQRFIDNILGVLLFWQ